MPRLLPIVAFGLLACGTASTPQPEAPSAAAADEGASSPEQPPVVAIPKAQNPLPGIVTGGVPAKADLEQAQRLGYRTVVSLLPAEETEQEAAIVSALGMHFVSIPVAGAGDLTEENARKLGDVLGAPQSRPLILHCASGNRSGALLALYAFHVEGASPDEALALGEAAGLTTLRDAVESKLRRTVE